MTDPMRQITETFSRLQDLAAQGGRIDPERLRAASEALLGAVPGDLQSLLERLSQASDILFGGGSGGGAGGELTEAQMRELTNAIISTAFGIVMQSQSTMRQIMDEAAWG